MRLLGFAGIFVFNALMWVLFTKSMHLCSSTLEATAFNTSSNFIFTVSIECYKLVGVFLFVFAVALCLGYKYSFMNFRDLRHLAIVFF